MLVIRLQRTGRKKQPSFRLVVQEKTWAPSSKSVEILGFYNPRTKEKGFKTERIEHWIKNGAQPTDSVFNLLVAEGVLKGDKRKAVAITKKRGSKIADKQKEAAEKAEAEKAAKAEAEAAAKAEKEEAPAQEPVSPDGDQSEPKQEEKTEEVAPEEKPAEEAAADKE